jgi:hypothetical protein
MIAFRALDVNSTDTTKYTAFQGEATSGTNRFNLNMTGTAQNFLAGVTGIGIAAAAGAWVTLGAGTTTVASEVYTSGTVLTTAAAGAMEFDGTCLYHTAAASSRQVVNAEQLSTVQGSTVTLANNTNAQAWLPAANDTLTVQASTTYEFEALIEIEGMGTVSRTISTLFGGTATFTSIQYWSMTWAGVAAASATLQATKVNQVATAVVVVPASTTAATALVLRGIMRINGAGTLIPQVQFSADPTGTIVVALDSYFRIWPVGSNTVASVGNWA